MANSEERSASPLDILFLACDSVVSQSTNAIAPSNTFKEEPIYGGSLLIEYIMKQNIPNLLDLLNSGADPCGPCQEGMYPIFYAVSTGDKHIVELMVEGGADINAISPNGTSPLMQAAHFGHASIVDLLLTREAVVNHSNIRGNTPLMRACQEGYLSIAQRLIQCNADINKRNIDGMTSLMLAAQRGHDDIVQDLINNGADVNMQTNRGSTCLMILCKLGRHYRCIELLLHAGADPLISDHDGGTPLTAAIAKNHTDVVSLLTETCFRSTTLPLPVLEGKTTRMVPSAEHIDIHTSTDRKQEKRSLDSLYVPSNVSKVTFSPIISTYVYTASTFDGDNDEGDYSITIDRYTPLNKKRR